MLIAIATAILSVHYFIINIGVQLSNSNKIRVGCEENNDFAWGKAVCYMVFCQVYHQI